jgi:hypothetical protein
MTGVTVNDGPFVTVPDGDYLTVGWTPEGDLTSGQQTWAGLGNKARDEQIDIPCYCDSYSGSTDVPCRRTAAFALLAAAENAVRADPTLGGVVPSPGWCQVGSYSERQEQTEAGLAVGVVFHILVQTRI